MDTKSRLSLPKMLDVNEVRVSGIAHGFTYKKMEVSKMPVKWTLPEDKVAPLRARFALKVASKRIDMEPALRIGSRAICSPDRMDMEMHRRLQVHLWCEAYGPIALYLKSQELQNHCRLYLEGCLTNQVKSPRAKRTNHLHVYNGISGLLVQKAEVLDRPNIAKSGYAHIDGDLYDRLVDIIEERAPDFPLLEKLKQHRAKKVYPRGMTRTVPKETSNG